MDTTSGRDTSGSSSRSRTPTGSPILETERTMKMAKSENVKSPQKQRSRTQDNQNVFHSRSSDSSNAPIVPSRNGASKSSSSSDPFGFNVSSDYDNFWDDPVVKETMSRSNITAHTNNSNDNSNKTKRKTPSQIVAAKTNSNPGLRNVWVYNVGSKKFKLARIDSINAAPKPKLLKSWQPADKQTMTPKWLLDKSHIDVIAPNSMLQKLKSMPTMVIIQDGPKYLCKIQLFSGC